MGSLTRIVNTKHNNDLSDIREQRSIRLLLNIAHTRFREIAVQFRRELAAHPLQAAILG